MRQGTDVNAEADIAPDQANGPEVLTASGQFVYLSEGAPALKSRQVGLVPGMDVPLLSVDLPAALRGHAREQVAERQLRDALSGGQDQVEIRPFHTGEDERSWTRVLTADRAQLDRWRRMAGPAARAVLPDYLALPAGAGLWTIVQQGDMVLARLGPEDGFAAQAPVALRLLRDALVQADPAPKAIYAPGPLRAELETLFASHDLALAQTPEALSALKLDAPRVLAHGELSFDLRRDPRAARAKLRASVLPWRWPLLVGLLAAGLWAGAQMLATQGLEDQTAQHRDATLAAVRADFVTSGPVLDVRTQVSRALAEARVAASGAGNDVSPLDLLGLASDVMTEAKAEPDYIDYSLAEGLSASVRVVDFAAADALAEALRAAGLAVEVVESRVSEGDEGVRTELRIAAPKPEEDG